MNKIEKVTITRKDGITYERKVKKPTKLTRCLCIRLDDKTFDRLKSEGNACTVIRQLINEHFKNDINGRNN